MTLDRHYLKFSYYTRKINKEPLYAPRFPAILRAFRQIEEAALPAAANSTYNLLDSSPS